MNRRPLGRTGLVVSPVGLGTVKLGRLEGLKYAAPAALPDDQTVTRLLATARDLGVNLIDTAPAYGVAEDRLGRLLPGPRDDWVIVTKAGERFEGGVSAFGFSPAAIRASIESSLRRLRLDHVDVLLVHSDGVVEADLDGPGLGAELDRIKQAGLARAVGVSTKTPRGALEAVRRTDVVMVTLNQSERADEPAVEAARAGGRGVLVKKALASGRAAGDAGGIGAAVRFVLDHPGVSSVVIGTTSPDHLRQCVAAGGPAA